MSADKSKKAPTAPEQPAAEGRDWRRLLTDVTQSSWLVVVLSIVASLVIASILAIIADEDVAEAAKTFGADPGGWFAAVGALLGDFYTALFRGAFFNANAPTFAGMFKPLTETMTMATPLIFAGLGLGIGFRAGLFNIGAQGQMIIGATLGGYIGFAAQMPWGLHLLFALIGCLLGGALWGFIPGLLKATTGAHEVITTIMLNYIALYFLQYLLTTTAFLRPGETFPKSPLIEETAELPLFSETVSWLAERIPLLFGWLPETDYRLNMGFLLALLAAWGVWWLMERSTWGFQFRSIGQNPHASRTAGMSVKRGTVLVMAIAGSLAGLAGGAQVLGTERALTSDIAGSFGFDAITVALLGRSRPLGTVMAALLFGALRASAPTLQVTAQLPSDIVLIVQSLIVLFIAAPPLVRFLFRLPDPKLVKEVTA